MDITGIPFNQFIGLRKVAAAAGELALDAAPKYLNHIGTVHAAAQFALAEACCGEYLLSRFADLTEGNLAVVRKAEIKYRKPAYGALKARASLADREADKPKRRRPPGEGVSSRSGWRSGTGRGTSPCWPRVRDLCKRSRTAWDTFRLRRDEILSVDGCGSGCWG
jgi:hypothetical protein